MTIVAAITIASGLMCLYAGLLAIRLARAPGWGEQRVFALVALSAAGFVFCDLAFTLRGTSDELVVMAARVQLIPCGVNVIAWLLYSRSVWKAGRLPSAVRVFAALFILATVVMLIPGVSLTGNVFELRSESTGEVYRIAEPKTAGIVFCVVAVLAILGIAVRHAMAWRRGVPDAFLQMLAMLVLVVAAINDTLVTAGMIDTLLLLDVGYTFPVGVNVLLLTAHVVDDAKALAELSSSLERKVEVRSRELVEAQDRLHRAEKLAAIGQLAAGVAHEINNPAAVIRSNLSYLIKELQSGDLPDDASECLDDSLIAAERIGGIVKTMSMSARSVSTTEAANVPVCVRDVVGTAVDAVRKVAGADIEVDLLRDLFVSANEPFLVQVLTNLMTNAHQAAPPDRAVKIRVTARSEGGFGILAVHDDGVGMTPEVQRRLFEAFFTTKPVGKGTGLGLTVSLGLVKTMGGTLDVASEPGRGTTMTITLALAPPPVLAPSPPSHQGSTRDGISMGHRSAE